MIARPIGVIHSSIKTRAEAPKQSYEGAPDAWLEIYPFAADGLFRIKAGYELIIITWLHQSNRKTLKVHPRSDPKRRLTGVFATRSPDRPNPLGLHRVTVRKRVGRRLLIGSIGMIDGTPVADVKVALSCSKDS